MEGIFVLKTICVKTDNENISKYLLEELDYFKIYMFLAITLDFILML